MRSRFYRLFSILTLLFLGSAMQAQTARVQLIHNSPDTALSPVDIWINDTLAYSNLSFREATPFTSIDANVTFDLTITAAGAPDTSNGLFRLENIFYPTGTSVTVAAGVVSPGYMPATPFNVYTNLAAREVSASPGNTELSVFHGSTDAPGVDVSEISVPAGLVINNLSFGNFSSYLSLATNDYVLRVQDSTGAVTVGEYLAPLASLGLQDSALTVVASGFLDPSMNNNGADFGLFAALPSGGPLVQLPQSTAPVQIIHNSADPAAGIVDVWVNNNKAVSNFLFQTATPFVDLPTGVNLDISITAPGSVDTTGAVFRASGLNLEWDKKYTVVANGIVSSSGFSPNVPFNLYVNDMAREMASAPGNTDVQVFHGVTDAPPVDVSEVGVGAGLVIDNLNYGEFAGYLPLNTDDYVLRVQDSSQSVTVGDYQALLQTLGLQDSALVVVASGFLTPDSNSNGPAFGLYVALPQGGPLVQLPENTAPVQVIHNSADLAADTVDVWYNNLKILPNFAFRTASPFVNLPTGTSFDISITAPGAVDTTGSVFRATGLSLNPGEKYAVIANGIVSSSGYTPTQPFNLYIANYAQEEASGAGNTDVLVFHGATDAPAVRVNEIGVGAGNIISGLTYGNFDPAAGYLPLATDDYILQVEDNGQTTIVGEYLAPLQSLGLEDSALIVVASGFYNRANNSNGAGFGLWAALPQGGPLVELPVSTAPVQIIHNSGDETIDTVDVWIDDVRVLDDLTFRSASPFLDLPTGVSFDLKITGPNAVDTTSAFFRAEGVSLSAGQKYIAVADGIMAGPSYNPSPAFDVTVFDQARTMAATLGNTDVLVYHGVTDAPPVDVNELIIPAGTVVDNLNFREFSGYLPLNTFDYLLQVQDSTGSVTVGEYLAPLSTLGLQDSAITVLASGFLDPSNNSDGPEFGLWVALPQGGDLIPLPISTSPVQLVHNAADLAADTVDVWYNDELLVDDFVFRTATPFVDLPTGVQFDISITGPAAADTVGAVYRETGISLLAEEKYIVVANGIVSGAGYSPVEPFQFFGYDFAQEEASVPGNTDVLVFHGATDAPAVDVEEIGVGAGVLVNNLEYGNYAGYLNLPTNDYVLQVQDSTGSVVVGDYLAPLSSLGLQDSAIAVMASGFLNPANNSNGPAFGLWVALPSGGSLIPLPLATTGVQVLHNSSDAAADTVDVWIDNTRAIPGFRYRTATPVIQLPSGSGFTISITGPGAPDTTNAVFRAEGVSLDYNSNYKIVANGIVSGAGYSPSVPFGLDIFDMARFQSAAPGNTDVLVYHGVTDAPSVDVNEIDVPAGRIVDNLEFGNFAGYLPLGTADYVLQVQDSTGSVTVGEYRAPLASLGLQDSAITVLASGFLNPANNSNGPGFGLFAALSSGGDFIPLPVNTAPIQVIHNSADLAASTVDVWIDNTKAIPNFAFRTATPFIDLPTGVGMDISVTAAGSNDTTGAVYRLEDLTLVHNSSYIAVANGIVSGSGYSPNVPFQLYLYDQAQQEAASSGTTDILAFHGSTDAPTVDITENQVLNQTIFDNLRYGEFQGYLQALAIDLGIGIEDSTGTTELLSYSAPLATLGLEDSAITILASGFLDSTMNSNGPGFGLWVALASGGNLIPLPENTGSGIIDVNGIDGDWSVYPNPTDGPVSLEIQLDRELDLAYRVIDLNGSIVFAKDGLIGSSIRDQFNLEGLGSGLYILEVSQNNVPLIQTPILKK